MLGRIMRIVKGDGAKGWHEEWRLEPDPDDESIPKDEVHQNIDPTILAGELKKENHMEGDHYLNLIEASLAQGGKHGDYSISVYWLKVILAGLQGKDVEGDVIFGEGSEEAPPTDNSLHGNLALV